MCGISPGDGVTRGGGVYWATTSATLQSTARRHSLHRLLSSLLVSLRGSRMIASHCDTGYLPVRAHGFHRLSVRYGGHARL